jgi:hypothetical protein
MMESDMNRAINALVICIFVGGFFTLLYFVAKKEQEDKYFCASQGMVYVQPFHGKHYCAAGLDIK